jgi:hypothetical protein
MVRAILAGAKTQTRRCLTPQPELAIMDAETATTYRACQDIGLIPQQEHPRWRWRGVFQMPWPECLRNQSPFGVVGDRLWVRETFYCDDYRYPDAPIDEMSKTLEYRASHECRNWEAGCPCRPGDASGGSCWRPSIHMPRWASRITLEVTGVRVERLQDITDYDARAEGVELGKLVPGLVNGEPAQVAVFDPRFAFAFLWDSINGKRPGCSWEANPWVWCVEFRRSA